MTVGRRRLNVLLIMADQLNPMVLPAYGGRARTPAIDRLAAAGSVFEAAYCNSPLCAPSRAAFMTGRLPSRTGGYDNAAPFGSDVPTFAHLMRIKGYRTTLAGKMHFAGPDQLHGFEERLTTDIYPADFGWTPDWARPERRPSWYHNMSSVADAGTCIRTNQLDFDEEVAFTAERAIFDAARGADDRPFCLVASLTHPHDPFAVPRRFFDLYTDEDAGLPRLGLGDVPLDPHSARLRHVSNMDVEPVSAAQVTRARRAYLGAVSFVDAIVGRLTGALEETGLADDTVVILTSDHGEMLGERGLWYKMSFLEGSARVPLIVHAPRHLPARRVAAAVSLVDLAPTLAGLAADGAEPEGVEGDRRTKPAAAPHRRHGPRRGDRRVPRRRRRGAGGDDPPRRPEVRPQPGRPRPALRPVRRSRRAGEPCRRSGPRRRGGGAAGGGRPALGPRCPRHGGAGEPAAAPARRRGPRRGRRPEVGPPALPGRLAQLHPPLCRPRRPRGAGPLPARARRHRRRRLTKRRSDKKPTSTIQKGRRP